MPQEPDFYQPGSACRKCQAESARPHYHERPVLIVFGSGQQWPCSGKDREMGAHFCFRCETCGYAWCEEIPAGAPGPG